MMIHSTNWNMTAKSARDDREQYWAEIATSVEQASTVCYTRKLYQLIRQVSGKPSTLKDLACDANDGFIVDNSVKVEHWLPCDRPSDGEVADAIRKLRNNKVPREDGIPAEIYKSRVNSGALAPRGDEILNSPSDAVFSLQFVFPVDLFLKVVIWPPRAFVQSNANQWEVVLDELQKDILEQLLVIVGITRKQ
nr:unnamed protein product [Spirometra erinaceieuropaei]